MSKKKNYWYVLVFSNEGPKFVTSVDYKSKVARWDSNEKPLEMSQINAEDLAFGLSCNFNMCCVSKFPYELDVQPYKYDKGHFEWVVDNKVVKCCYCGKEITDISDSNNPFDGSDDFYKRYSEDDRCCGECNDTIVIPARMKHLYKED